MNVPLYVEQRGEGEVPLVCLHGWGMNLRVFDAIRAAVEPVGISSWAIDLPGHGHSRWDPARADFASQLQDVLSSLPPRCVLLGWSLGGQFALEIARVAPLRVLGLVLFSTTPRFGRTGDWDAGLDPATIALFREALARDWLHTLDDFVQLQLRGSRHAVETLALIREALKSHGAPRREALEAGLALLATIDLRRHAAGITHPALVIAGQNDRVTPPAASQWLVSRMPRSSYLEIERAGHAPFLSHVEDCAEPLREFLADVAGSPA